MSCRRKGGSVAAGCMVLTGIGKAGPPSSKASG